jgi:16S rRNA U1498 N3-methylase RsmE
MNTILLENSDFTAPGRVVLSDYRLEHMRKVLKSAPGSRCKVGLMGGNLGTGEVLTIDAESAELQITLDTPPPAELDLVLACAMQRPQTYKKVLHIAVGTGKFGLSNKTVNVNAV